jgi:6-phosphogluconolactonase
MVKVMRGLVTIMMGAGIVTPMLYAAEATNTNATETVFVMTNNADKNEVISFERSADGTFSENNRYDTGGRGSGGIIDPLEAQGALTLNPDHSLLFAANAGSGTLSVFRVHHGALTLTDKVPTGGAAPIAAAQFQNYIYVLNAGGAGSVVAFHFDDDGRLRQIKDSTVFLTSAGSLGSSLTISPDGKFVAVTELVPNHVDTFQIEPNGKLAPIVVNTSTGPGAFAARFAPDGKLVVSETGPAGATNGSATSSYTVLPNGKLSVISKSVPTLGAANCWNAITPDGKYVYESNSGSATIAGFSLGKNGVLTPISGTVVGTNPEGSVNLDIAISSDGKYLFTLNSGAGTVGVFEIRQDGTLSNVGEIPGLTKSDGFEGMAAL